MDDGLPSTVTVLDAPDGGKVYLVGTAHFSIQSQEDVSRVCVLFLVVLNFVSFHGQCPNQSFLLSFSCEDAMNLSRIFLPARSLKLTRITEKNSVIMALATVPQYRKTRNK